MTTMTGLRRLRGVMIFPVVFLLCIAFLVSVVSAKKAAGSPNLIIALADDFSAIEIDHLTFRNGTLEGAKTPTLNKMKNRGVSFLTAWSMPICGPTRGSILTGLYGQVTGWLSNKKPNDVGLGRRFGTFANLAQSNGYKTMIAGKWQMTGEIKSYGFDEACLWANSDDPDSPPRKFYSQYRKQGGYVNPQPGALFGQRSRYWAPFMFTNGTMIRTGPKVFGPNVVFDCAKDFMSRQKALGNKFLIYMPMLLTHADWDYFRPKKERKITNFIPVPKVNKKGKIMGREPGPGSMKRNIEYQDYLMGGLLKHVKKIGERKKTVTFFIGDNGSLGYGKKEFVSERATRVPFVVYGPGHIKARRETNQFASVNDVYATAAGLMKANTRRDFPRPQSVDMARFLRGGTRKSGRAWLYGYLSDPVKKTRGRWIRNRRFILDGQKVFWRCPTYDERSCVEIVPRAGSAAMRAKKRFDKIICLLEKEKPVNPRRMVQRGRCRK